jgi:hypothetical protein
MAHRTHSKHSNQPTGAIATRAVAQANSLIEHEAVPTAMPERSEGGNPATASDARHRAWLRRVVRRGK